MPNIVGLIDGGWTDVQIPDVSPSGGSWHMGTLLCVVWVERVWDSVCTKERSGGGVSTPITSRG